MTEVGSKVPFLTKTCAVLRVVASPNIAASSTRFTSSTFYGLSTLCVTNPPKSSKITNLVDLWSSLNDSVEY